MGGAGTHTALLGCSGLLRAGLFTDLNAFREGDIFYVHILGRTLPYRLDACQSMAEGEVSFPVAQGKIWSP
ncbi:MAG: hypothetical protein ACLU9S_19650 [Oscillospiraceae bacterium]